MQKITWINFLHIYQPPTQTPEVLEKVTKESYENVLRLLETYPTFKITLNMSGSLIELLVKNGREDVLKKFRKFVENGQVELVGSAMYHPILALLPEAEVRHQIELNTTILKKYFGESLKLPGFFIPEMAYSKKIGEIVKDMGFTWIILDEINVPKEVGTLDPKIKYEIKDVGLNVLFRNRYFSKTFPPEYISEHKNDITHPYIIIAHDGELYGHWHRDDKGYYKKAFTDSDIRMITVSEYLKELSTSESIQLRDGSWESLEEELVNNIPFALWNDEGNSIHEKMWKFAEFAIKTVTEHHDDPNYTEARSHLDRGLASCAWWWGSERIPAAFSPLTWNPTEIEKGAIELLLSIRSYRTLDLATYENTETMFGELRNTIWKHHWQLQDKNK